MVSKNDEMESESELVRKIELDFEKYNEGKDEKLQHTIEINLDQVLEVINKDATKVPVDIASNIAPLAEIADELGLDKQRRQLDGICRAHHYRSFVSKSGGIRDYPEFELRDYLVDRNLSQIEPDLKYLSHEMSIATGRIDIFASDANNRRVIIELKARDYRASELDHQARKYLGELREVENDPRVIIVAPKIKSDLFSALREYSEKGEVTFYEFSRKGKQYSFKHIPHKSLVDKLDGFTERSRPHKKPGERKVTPQFVNLTATSKVTGFVYSHKSTGSIRDQEIVSLKELTFSDIDRYLKRAAKHVVPDVAEDFIEAAGNNEMVRDYVINFFDRIGFSLNIINDSAKKASTLADEVDRLIYGHGYNFQSLKEDKLKTVETARAGNIEVYEGGVTSLSLETLLHIEQNVKAVKQQCSEFADTDLHKQLASKVDAEIDKLKKQKDSNPMAEIFCNYLHLAFSWGSQDDALLLLSIYEKKIDVTKRLMVLDEELGRLYFASFIPWSNAAGFKVPFKVLQEYPELDNDLLDNIIKVLEGKKDKDQLLDETQVEFFTGASRKNYRRVRLIDLVHGSNPEDIGQLLPNDKVAHYGQKYHDSWPISSPNKPLPWRKVNNDARINRLVSAYCNLKGLIYMEGDSVTEGARREHNLLVYHAEKFADELQQFDSKASHLYRYFKYAVAVYLNVEGQYAVDASIARDFRKDFSILVDVSNEKMGDTNKVSMKMMQQCRNIGQELEEIKGNLSNNQEYNKLVNTIKARVALSDERTPDDGEMRAVQQSVLLNLELRATGDVCYVVPEMIETWRKMDKINPELGNDYLGALHKIMVEPDSFEKVVRFGKYAPKMPLFFVKEIAEEYNRRALVLAGTNKDLAKRYLHSAGNLSWALQEVMDQIFFGLESPLYDTVEIILSDAPKRAIQFVDIMEHPKYLSTVPRKKIIEGLGKGEGFFEVYYSAINSYASKSKIKKFLKTIFTEDKATEYVLDDSLRAPLCDAALWEPKVLEDLLNYRRQNSENKVRILKGAIRRYDKHSVDQTRINLSSLDDNELGKIADEMDYLSQLKYLLQRNKSPADNPEKNTEPTVTRDAPLSKTYAEKLYATIIPQKSEQALSSVSLSVKNFCSTIAQAHITEKKKTDLLHAMNTAYDGKPLYKCVKHGVDQVRMDKFLSKVQEMVLHGQVPKPERLRQMYGK